LVLFFALSDADEYKDLISRKEKSLKQTIFLIKFQHWMSFVSMYNIRSPNVEKGGLQKDIPGGLYGAI